MGEGTTRVVEADGTGSRVRELGNEIRQARRWLNALVTELDRRRHNVTSLKPLLREHTVGVAAGALVLAAVVAAPLAISQARRRRRSSLALARHGGDLTDKALRLGRALGRVAQDPDRLAAAPPLTAFGLATGTLAAVMVTAAQALARAALERRGRPDGAARRS